MYLKIRFFLLIFLFFDICFPLLKIYCFFVFFAFFCGIRFLFILLFSFLNFIPFLGAKMFTVFGHWQSILGLLSVYQSCPMLGRSDWGGPYQCETSWHKSRKHGFWFCYFQSCSIACASDRIHIHPDYTAYRYWQIINSQIFIPWYKVAKRPR